MTDKERRLSVLTIKIFLKGYNMAKLTKEKKDAVRHCVKLYLDCSNHPTKNECLGFVLRSIKGLDSYKMKGFEWAALTDSLFDELLGDV
jgi:hypothetical protein